MNGKLHHIELYVDRLAEAREFWGWFLGWLGYELHQEWSDGFSYILEDTYIVFVRVAEKHRGLPYHRCRPGINHLAFHVDARSDVDRLTAELRTKGVTILYEDRHPFAGGEEHYAVYFEDPFRMKVEVVAETQDSIRHPQTSDEL